MITTHVSRRLSTRPYSLNAIHQLPEALLELAKFHLSSEQVVEGIFVVPPETYKRGFRWHMNPLQALIFTQQGILQIAGPSAMGESGRVSWVSTDDVIKIKLSQILLYGKLEVSSEHDAQGCAIEVEYNTVSHHLLVPHLRQLISKTWLRNPSSGLTCNPDPSFANFVNTSYSFYNGLVGGALQPDEAVLGYLYQPEIQAPWLKMFHKKLFPQTVLALTNQQLILLQEDLKLKTHYEWIFTFIPLYRIKSMEQVAYKNWQIVSIHFIAESHQQPIDLILEAGNAKKWCTIWTDNMEKV